MSDKINHVVLNEGRIEKVEATSEGQRPSILINENSQTTDSDHEAMETSTCKIVENNKIKRINENGKISSNEIYHTVQALLLVSTIFILSYHGMRYGPIEYSLLENGQSVNGLVPPRKAVVTLSLGYSLTYSLISSLAALMLVYSLVSMKPYWSLPTIVLCIAEVVWEVGDAIVAFWLLFTRMKFTTAVSYTAGAVFVIIGELWCWLGVVRLYEMRSFERNF